MNPEVAASALTNIQTQGLLGSVAVIALAVAAFLYWELRKSNREHLADIKEMTIKHQTNLEVVAEKHKEALQENTKVANATFVLVQTLRERGGFTP